MIVLGYMLFGLGCIATIVGEVRFLAVTYRHGAGCLFACLFFPFAGWMFFLTHFKETWRPALLNNAGFAVACVGCWLGGFDV